MNWLWVVTLLFSIPLSVQAAEWQEFKISDGTIVRADMASIRRDVNLGKIVGGTVDVDTSNTSMPDIQRFLFDCNGTVVAVMKAGNRITKPLKPNTVAATLDGIVCRPTPRSTSQQHRWTKFEADNGEVVQLDMNTLLRGDHAGEIVIYMAPPNVDYDPGRMQRLRFTCVGDHGGGQYQDMTGGYGFGVVLDAPPRSVAGFIADFVCAQPVGYDGSRG